MEFHKEILSQMLSRYELQVTIPQLELDIKSLFELECYRALYEIKCILEDNNNSDEDCFIKIEEIIHIIDELGASSSIRHDFG